VHRVNDVKKRLTTKCLFLNTKPSVKLIHRHQCYSIWKQQTEINPIGLARVFRLNRDPAPPSAAASRKARSQNREIYGLWNNIVAIYQWGVRDHH
jgi:hypothetical protein